MFLINFNFITKYFLIGSNNGTMLSASYFMLMLNYFISSFFIRILLLRLFVNQITVICIQNTIVIANFIALHKNDLCNFNIA